MRFLHAMRLSGWRLGAGGAALAACLVSPPLLAADACAQFKWDVSHEHALFQQQAGAVSGAAAADGAPVLKPDTLYDVALQPQDGVHFAHAPGKKMITDGAYAGLARIKVEKAGHYRVSLGTPLWIDVVDGEQLLPTVDFGGSAGCDTPHKVVEFEFPAGHELVLQLSAGTAKDVRLSVTPIAAAP